MMSEVMKAQPKYFRQGTVMNTLIESGMEVVWFSDMTQNDVVYGICVQREEKIVTVVFRGTVRFFLSYILCLDDKQLTPPFVGRQVNAHNWNMNLRFKTNAYPNPVKQNYPGRADTISLQSGFALYLLRNRKDTGMSKLQEIDTQFCCYN